MRKPIARALRDAALAALSPSEKLDLAEKESREVLALNPGYAEAYLRRKRARRADGHEEGRPAPPC